MYIIRVEHGITRHEVGYRGGLGPCTPSQAISLFREREYTSRSYAIPPVMTLFLSKRNYPDFLFTDLDEKVLWYVQTGPGFMRSTTEIIERFITLKARPTIFRHLKSMEKGLVLERVVQMVGRYHVYYRPRPLGEPTKSASMSQTAGRSQGPATSGSREAPRS